jgi:hypothetical protein
LRQHVGLLLRLGERRAARARPRRSRRRWSSARLDGRAAAVARRNLPANTMKATKTAASAIIVMVRSMNLPLSGVPPRVRMSA